MNKKRIAAMTLCIMMLGTIMFTSCSKDDNACSTCVITDNAGNVIKNYGEKCGTAADVDEYESSSRADAAQISGTCNCNRK